MIFNLQDSNRSKLLARSSSKIVQIQEMEEQIRIFSKGLTSFCNHLQSNCDALKLSLDRRPIPLDSASSTFIQCLNRRVSAAATDLNLLESMSFGTVSFEELLGHCNEVYKKNQNDLLQLEDWLESFGYVPEVEIDGDDDDSNMTPLSLETKDQLDLPSVLQNFEEDSPMDESMKLKSLGLSDVCLATLASEADTEIGDPDMITGQTIQHYDGKHSASSLDHTTELTFSEIGFGEDAQNSADAVGSIIEVSKEGYESLPSYLKNLTSWEDLLAAVEKINLRFTKKGKTNGLKYFRQDEISSLGLGPKARTYLLLLVRMNHLVVDTIDGSISYKLV